MEKTYNYAVIRDGYVINVILGGEEPPKVDQAHDQVVRDEIGNVGAGDWYADNERIFYRPLSIPKDLPEELKA